MSKSRFNRAGYPSPESLGFKRGQSVAHTYNGVEYTGKVARVFKHCIRVIDDSNQVEITCHPYALGGFRVVTP